MTDAQHRRLARLLNQVGAKVAVSRCRCDVMDSLYKDWNRFEAPRKRCHSVKKARQEALWMNY